MDANASGGAFSGSSPEATMSTLDSCPISTDGIGTDVTEAEGRSAGSKTLSSDSGPPAKRPRLAAESTDSITASDLVGPLGCGQAPCYDLRPYDDAPARHSSLAVSPAAAVVVAAELLRASGLARLRKLLNTRCESELGVRAPQETLNRWLFAMLAVSPQQASTIDPLLRRPELATETDVVSHQLQEAVPASSYVSWSDRRNPRAVLRVVVAWIDAAQQWLRKSEALGEPASRARTALASARAGWASRPSSNLLKLFGELRDECVPFFKLACAEPSRKVCGAIVEEAQKVAGEIAAAVDSQVSAPAPAVDVEFDSTSRFFRLRCGGDIQFVRELHARKLRALFDSTSGRSAGSGEAGNYQEFLIALWALLRRYQTFFGDVVGGGETRRQEGAAFHAAAPEPVFRVLTARLGVHHECFASPFNCYYRSFCSAFPDTDAPFGSHGSFFSFHPARGSFEVGPPYTVEVMERTARHCDELLRAAAEDAPLSFVVFVPDWRRPLQPAQVLMEASPYLRRNMLVSGRAHSYVIGDQHTSSRDRHFVLPFDTRIYCLQNAAGAARWPSDDAFEAALMGAFAET